MAVFSRTPSDMSCHSWNCRWKSSGRCAGRRKILGLLDFTKKNEDLTALKQQTRGLNQQKICVFQARLHNLIYGFIMIYPRNKRATQYSYYLGPALKYGLDEWRIPTSKGFWYGVWWGNKVQPNTATTFFRCKYDSKCQAQLNLVNI